MMDRIGLVTCTAAGLLAINAMAGCNNNTPPTKPPADPQTHDEHDGHDHASHDDHDHDHADHDHADHADHDHADHDHSAIAELGSGTIGSYTVRATRDLGAVTAGGEVAVDAWLTGDLTQVASVRFWVGTADASGSIKAKAALENASEPNHWHTHVEVPDPLPLIAELWVEIETTNKQTFTGSFDLKMTP